MTDWVSFPHLLGWGFLFALMLAYELYALWWNRNHPGKRANLTAYISAFFRVGPRRLKYSAGAAVLIATFAFFLLHFLGYVW